MKLALAALVLGVITACDKKRDEPRPEPQPVGSAERLPDTSTIDWKNMIYGLGSLGSVKADDGRAEFRVEEDDTGVERAVQGGAGGEWRGFLDVDEPSYADLDGDGHDESVIPFELKSAQLDDTPHVFGVFVFTLRAGQPVKLGTITTTAKPGFTVDGNAIKTTDGKRWTWSKHNGQLVERQ